MSPLITGVMGVIVLTLCVSVFLSVHLAIPAEQTYGLEFLHGGLVEGYLGQGHWTKGKVMRSKFFRWDVPLTSESFVHGQETQEYEW